MPRCPGRAERGSVTHLAPLRVPPDEAAVVRLQRRQLVVVVVQALLVVQVVRRVQDSLQGWRQLRGQGGCRRGGGGRCRCRLRPEQMWVSEQGASADKGIKTQKRGTGRKRGNRLSPRAAVHTGQGVLMQCSETGGRSATLLQSSSSTFWSSWEHQTCRTVVPAPHVTEHYKHSEHKDTSTASAGRSRATQKQAAGTQPTDTHPLPLARLPGGAGPLLAALRHGGPLLGVAVVLRHGARVHHARVGRLANAVTARDGALRRGRRESEGWVGAGPARGTLNAG